MIYENVHQQYMIYENGLWKRPSEVHDYENAHLKNMIYDNDLWNAHLKNMIYENIHL